MSAPDRYGLIGEFTSAREVRDAALTLHSAGIRALDAFTPYPIEGLDDILDPAGRPRLPMLIALGALIGAVLGYGVQYWAAAVDYPLNVGGRPCGSWPAFTVSAFEVTLLCAVTVGFVAFLVFCRLPLLYHPVFTLEDFERASHDRFFLCVEAKDPRFDDALIARVLVQHGAERVASVPS
ncbi:MAG TPA: DUF3341 domain-containing protein [Stellaceae bacterium]|nr:DUF3341 domain-containing protein [Stellaceae bacterium]